MSQIQNRQLGSNGPSVSAIGLGCIVPIPGSTRARRVAEDLGALDVQLSAADVASLDALAPTVAGERYAEGGMRAVNR